MKRVIVHVDRVVMKGVRPDRERVVATQLRERLEQEFRSHDAISRLRTPGSVPRLNLEKR